MQCSTPPSPPSPSLLYPSYRAPPPGIFLFQSSFGVYLFLNLKLKLFRLDSNVHIFTVSSIRRLLTHAHVPGRSRHLSLCWKLLRMLAKTFVFTFVPGFTLHVGTSFQFILIHLFTFVTWESIFAASELRKCGSFLLPVVRPGPALRRYAQCCYHW